MCLSPPLDSAFAIVPCMLHCGNTRIFFPGGNSNYRKWQLGFSALLPQGHRTFQIWMCSTCGLWKVRWGHFLGTSWHTWLWSLTAYDACQIPCNFCNTYFNRICFIFSLLAVILPWFRAQERETLTKNNDHLKIEEEKSRCGDLIHRSMACHFCCIPIYLWHVVGSWRCFRNFCKIVGESLMWLFRGFL